MLNEGDFSVLDSQISFGDESLLLFLRRLFLTMVCVVLIDARSLDCFNSHRFTSVGIVKTNKKEKIPTVYYLTSMLFVFKGFVICTSY